MRKTILLILVFISVLLLVLRFGGLISSQLFQSANKGGLKISSVPSAEVYINDEQVGKTPFQNESLLAGEYRIKIGSASAVWQGQVEVTGGTLTVVNRELADNQASSSGEVLVLDSGSGVVITSTPTGSSVDIDGKEAGKTPLAVSSLTAGDHTFTLSHDGYLKRSIRAYLPDKLKLSLDVDLAISEVDLSTIDAPTVQVAEELVVRSTPTGFLRVRDKPSLAGAEIGRLDVGVTVTLIEQQGGWSKINMSDGKQGYVSSRYVGKKTL